MPAAISKPEVALPAAWQRYASIAVASLVVGAMLWPLWRGAGEGADIAPVCAEWDDLARDSVARLVQNGRHDADLRQVGDAIFLLRRARRNCHAGWTALACQDYLAASRTGAARLSRSPECATAKAQALGGAH